MRRHIIPLMGLLISISTVGACTADHPVVDSCTNPLILYADEEVRGRSIIHCIGHQGPVSLGIEGDHPVLSPTQNWVAYVRFSPNDSMYTLYLHSFETGREIIVGNKAGFIQKFWVDSADKLLIASWDRFPQLEAYNYPSSYSMYYPATGELIDLNWPRGYFVGDVKDRNVSSILGQLHQKITEHLV